MLGLELPLLYFLFLPWCHQILASNMTVQCPPAFHLRYVAIILLLLYLLSPLGIYNYIPETNHVSMVYSVASVLYLQFVLHVTLFHPWNMLCTITLVLSIVCVQCPMWLFFVVPKFCAFLVCWSGIARMILKWFQLPLLLLVCCCCCCCNHYNIHMYATTVHCYIHVVLHKNMVTVETNWTNAWCWTVSPSSANTSQRTNFVSVIKNYSVGTVYVTQNIVCLNLCDNRNCNGNPGNQGVTQLLKSHYTC